MALPSNHDFSSVHVGAFSPSIGGTPEAAYARAIFAGRLGKITLIAGGAITTADCTLTVKNETTATTLGTFTLPVASAAAAQLTSYTPDTAAHAAVSQDDVISITPAGASGSNIRGHFAVAFVPKAPA